jgi:hypothetical protein
LTVATQRVRLIALTLVGILFPIAAQPQQEPPPGPPPATELVFEREVFEYPSFPRSNPFVPLSATAGGPRFEQLSLTGIMWDADPTYSVALLTTGVVSVTPGGSVTVGPGEAYNAKVGQRIGNTTIREIQRDRVIVDVEEFGLIERETMVIVSRRPGGTP